MLGGLLLLLWRQMMVMTACDDVVVLRYCSNHNVC